MKILLLLDYDGDKVFKTKDKAIIAGIKRAEDGSALPIIISPMESVKAHKCVVTKESLFELDNRTLDNLTGKYTNMGTFYQNQLLHIRWAFGEFLNNYETATRSACYSYYKKLFPESPFKAQDFEDDRKFNKAIAIVRKEFTRIVQELRYKIIVVRFASASEIDFVKHGVRMPFPKDVATSEKLEWLAEAKNGGKLNIPENAEMKLLKYNTPAWVWTYTNDFNKVIEKRLYRFNTPMQVIRNHVKASWNEMVNDVKVNAKKTSILLELMADKEATLPASAVAMLENVRELRRAYNTERVEANHKLKLGVYSPEQYEAVSKDINRRHIEATCNITDRESFALASLYVGEIEKDTDDLFTFVCAFDGIIGLLTKQASVSVRNIKVDVPAYTNAITVAEDGTATYVHPYSGEVLPVELPEVAFAPGEYAVFDSINARYMNLTKTLTGADKESIVKYAYNQQIGTSKVHAVNVRKGVSYNMTISGFKFHNDRAGVPFTAETALKALQRAGNKARIVEEEFPNGEKRPSIEVAGQIIATVKALDSFRLVDDGTVNFRNMYNKIVTLDTSNSEAFITCGEQTRLAGSLKVVASVESIVPIAVQLEDWHEKCNLEKWYFQCGVVESENRFKTFADFGYNVLSFEIAPKILKNSLIATIVLERKGEIVTVPVGYVNAEQGLGLGTVTKGEEVVDTNRAGLKPLIACIYREVSFAFAKRDYVPAEVTLPGEEEYYAKLKALREARKAKRQERKDQIAFWKGIVQKAKAEKFTNVHQYTVFEAELKRITNM